MTAHRQTADKRTDTRGAEEGGKWHQEACPLSRQAAGGCRAAPKRMTEGSRVRGQAFACGYHEAGQGSWQSDSRVYAGDR